MPIVAYNRARVWKSTDAKLMQEDRNTFTNKEITVCFVEVPETYISLANLF